MDPVVQLATNWLDVADERNRWLESINAMERLFAKNDLVFFLLWSGKLHVS